MAYTQQSWADSDPSKPVSAARMTVIENGINATATVADGAATQASSALTKITASDSIWRNHHKILGSYYGANLSAPVFPFGTTGAATGATSNQYIAQAVFWFDPSEWTISGYTHKLRLRTTTFGAATTATNTITFGIYSITGFLAAASGYGFTNSASPVTGTTTAHVNMATQTASRQATEFNASLLSAGYYAIGFVTNAAGVTTTTTFLEGRVDYRYV